MGVAMLMVSTGPDRKQTIEMGKVFSNNLSGAEERTRTSTGLPPQAPEAYVSTNSTTSAEMMMLI